jgi:3-dehydroquinate synthase
MINLQDYSILFQDNDFLQLRQFLSQNNYSSVFVLADSNTAEHCLPILNDALHDFDFKIILIEAGEKYKNIQTCEFIWNELFRLKADRKAVLLNLGGGVIGDMGGFSASTYKRGIDFIQIPTTLLAQVDASVGGKLGIDFSLVKNGIGLFNNPMAVYLNPAFFNTLPNDEMMSGFAEVIKHALIVDSEYWKSLKDVPFKAFNWPEVVERSVLIKKNIVEEDPFEKSVRKALNFGHTIGHAVESLSWETDNPLLHGEAVALGMIAEAFLSYKILGLSFDDLMEISDFISNLYPEFNLSQLDDFEILSLIQQDKKNEHQQLCFTLLDEIGKFRINVHADDELIFDALNFYKNIYP